MLDKKIFVIENKNLPVSLQKIKNSPKRLYALGNKNLIYEECFAVVGSRKITDYGAKYCEKIVKELALRNINIISGMAIGTDTIAHKTCLKYNSKTIAVLGGGFNFIYPKENVKLFNEILEADGLIISEYSPDEKYKSEYFPYRNRIISAISIGILVIEGAYRSGTSITAKYGKEQEKNIFAIPGRIDDKYSFITNEIIKKGAKLTTKVEDILESYPQLANKKRKTIVKNKENCDISNNKYSKIIKLLETGAKTIDEIIYYSNIDRKEALNILFEMQLNGIIEQKIGDGYILTKNNF